VLQRDRESTVYVARRKKNKPYVEGVRSIYLILQGDAGKLNFMLQRYRRKHEDSIRRSYLEPATQMFMNQKKSNISLGPP
jgi:hypothetical protein